MWGTQPRCLRRQLGEAAGEIGEAGLVGVGGRQGDFDAGDHLGDPPGHLDQPATLIRQRRIVSNCASRQNDVRGASPRRVSSSQ